MDSERRALTRGTHAERLAAVTLVLEGAAITPARAGGLVSADPETLLVLRVYIQELCNTSRTAQRLFIHRNTIIRRLVRTDELLPKPLADNIVAVAAALEVLHWTGEHAPRRTVPGHRGNGL